MCDYLSMLRLKLNHVSKRGHSRSDNATRLSLMKLVIDTYTSKLVPWIPNEIYFICYLCLLETDVFRCWDIFLLSSKDKHTHTFCSIYSQLGPIGRNWGRRRYEIFLIITPMQYILLSRCRCAWVPCQAGGANTICRDYCNFASRLWEDPDLYRKWQLHKRHYASS